MVIYTNFIVIESSMLHANYVIGLLVLEKIVKRFTIYGHVGHLGDQDHFYKLMSPLPEAPHISWR